VTIDIIRHDPLTADAVIPRRRTAAAWSSSACSAADCDGPTSGRTLLGGSWRRIE
jgi:hypothetical protein